LPLASFNCRFLQLFKPVPSVMGPKSASRILPYAVVNTCSFTYFRYSAKRGKTIPGPERFAGVGTALLTAILHVSARDFLQYIRIPNPGRDDLFPFKKGFISD
jgi:hypothetical protein